MKKLFILGCVLLLSSLVFAQRYAIIDTKYILDKMPDYKSAQKNLDDIAGGWQKEIEKMETELSRMYKDFDAEQVMLSEELRKKREDQLFVKEKAVRDLQRQRFGFEGDLFQKRQQLMTYIIRYAICNTKT